MDISKPNSAISSSSKEKCRRLLLKYVNKFAPNPNWMEAAGIKWIYTKWDQLTELDCYNLLKEIRKELDAS